MLYKHHTSQREGGGETVQNNNISFRSETESGGDIMNYKNGSYRPVEFETTSAICVRVTRIFPSLCL